MLKNMMIVVLSALVIGCAKKTFPASSENDMYKTYVVKKIAELIEINADWDKPAWQSI